MRGDPTGRVIRAFGRAAVAAALAGGPVPPAEAVAHRTALPILVTTIDTTMTIAGTENADGISLQGASAAAVLVAGGPVAAGPGCVNLGPDSARCTGVTLVRATLQGGDDRLTDASVLPVQALGGPGDDTLSGGAAVDLLVGGDGVDRCAAEVTVECELP